MKMRFTAALAALMACSSTFAATRMEIVNAKCNTTGEMMAVLLQQQNKPYSAGAQGDNAFDEPGLAVFALKQVGLEVPSDMVKLSKIGKVISKPAAMLPGDIVFFFDPTSKKKDIEKMGIVQSVNSDGSFTFFYVSKDNGVSIVSSHTDGFKGFFKQANRITTDKELQSVKAAYQKDVANIDKAKANLTKAQEAVKAAENALKDLENEFSKNNSATYTVK